MNQVPMRVAAIAAGMALQSQPGMTIGANRSNKLRVMHRHGFEVGVNDPCPCGSSRKYKRCHGRQR